MTKGMVFLAVFSSIFLFILIFELVRKRKLNIDLSWMWLLFSLIMGLIAFFPSVIFYFVNLIEARDASSIIFFICIAFLISIALNFSVKISDLSNKITILAQKISILDEEKNNENNE